jgi:long-chain acyl-CoA synthetase
MYNSLVELFAESCKKYASKLAYKNFDTTITYQQLENESRNFAAFLQNEFKLKKGAHIALMLPNILSYPICLFGAWQAGLVVINVNPLYSARELIFQLKDSAASAIVVLTDFADILQQALPETQVKNVIAVKTQAPFFKITKHKLQKVHITDNDLALLQYTGGTTGISKGAMLTHKNLLANIEQMSLCFDKILKQGQEITITILPLYHIFALTVCCLTFVKFGGLNILITNPRNLAEITEPIRKHKLTAFIGVNSLCNALLNNSAFRQLDFSSLKFSIAGGMAVQKTISDKWQQITGTTISQGYGLTEASPVVSMNYPQQKEFTNSIGLPMPFTQISIRDENGNELPLNTRGELCVKGPQVMQGYWQQDDETKQVFWPDNWLRTGDIATMDKKEFLYLVDRKKDMIITSGYNVYPNEIEEIIMSHPLVLEVAVIGIPSKHAGEIVKAFIVPAVGATGGSPTKKEIIAFCKKHLTSYKVPKRIEFRTELPKSNVGKILRKELRKGDPPVAPTGNKFFYAAIVGSFNFIRKYTGR